MKDTEVGLWVLVDAMRFEISPSDFVSILSQLCVLTTLARKDNRFAEAKDAANGASTLLIGELLRKGLTALDRMGVNNPTELINPNSSGWSSLPSSWTNQVLQELAKTAKGPNEMGRWLLRQARRRTERTIEYPNEVFSLMAALAPQADSVYLPFDDSALAFFEVTKKTQKVTLRPESERNHKLLRRALFVADRQATLQTLSPYSSEGIPDKSLTLLVPPFGVRLRSMPTMELPAIFEHPHSLNSEELALASIGVGSQRRVVALVPSGLLFRGGRSRSLREWLVDTLGLTAVIEFPPRLLLKTSIGFAVLTIETDRASKQDAIRLVATDGARFLKEFRSGRFRLTKWRELTAATLTRSAKNLEAVSDVDKPIIRDNDYVLNPGRYKTQDLERLLDGMRTTNLGSLCRIMFPVHIKDSEDDPASSFFEVLMSDFRPDGTVEFGSKERFLDVATASKARKRELRPGDILLGVKGTIGKVALVAETAYENLLAGQSTVILRIQDLDRVSDPVYLLRYLSLPAVRAFLESMAGGSAIRFIRAKDLSNLPVPILSAEQQSRIRATHEEIVEAIEESQHFSDQARRLNDQAFDLEVNPVPQSEDHVS